ncbi:TPA: GNAT family N-acetyltransferase, partial [Candidatus Poribacteria bacterium]|nr:GNAT family N-acetyltransferase [Candidatus Poribacteria bacterium]
KQEWLRILKKFEKKDASFIPEYAELYEINGDGKAQCFVYEENGDYVLYVFMKRKINDLPFMNSETVESFDIITPYGYGGPLCSSSDSGIKKNLMKGFFTSFNEYCREENIITEFIRFHPLLKTHEGCEQYLNVIKSCDNIYLDLTKSEEDIWWGFKSPRRRAIKKAKRNNSTVFHAENFEHFDKFVELYHQTMERVNADSYFFFSEEYYAFLNDKLRDNFELFFTKANGEIIAGVLFLCYGDYIHSYLGGAIEDSFSLRPNDLLYYEVALWAKKKGYKYLHFGGGEGGVYKFKQGFSKDTAEYFIGKLIRNKPIYQRICEKWNKYYPDKTKEDISFFPLYRA